MSDVYCKSEYVEARNVYGEFYLFYTGYEIYSMEDAILNLNETGKFIWDSIDGKKSVRDIAKNLAEACNAPDSIKEIEGDVIEFITELKKRKMIFE